MYKNSRDRAYEKACREEPHIGTLIGIRPEPTLDEARAELSEAISRVAISLFNVNHDLLSRGFSQFAINEFLERFESNLYRTKWDLNIAIEELLDRVVPKNRSKKI